MRPHQVILLLGFLASLAAYNLFSDSEDEMSYKLMAFCYVCVLYSYYRYVETKATKLMLAFFLAAAWGNLFDEIFFDPYIKSWHEYATALVALTWLLRSNVRRTLLTLKKRLWHKNSLRQHH